MVDGLIVSDKERLMALEATVERGWMEAAHALSIIQADRLYRVDGHETFEGYVRARFGWTRQSAYRHIQAVGVVENVTTTLHQGSLPSLSQAVELAPLPAEQQREAAASIDFSTTTVAEVRRVVRQIRAASPAVAGEEAKEGDVLETTTEIAPMKTYMAGTRWKERLIPVNQAILGLEDGPNHHGKRQTVQRWTRENQIEIRRTIRLQIERLQAWDDVITRELGEEAS